MTSWVMIKLIRNTRSIPPLFVLIHIIINNHIQHWVNIKYHQIYRYLPCCSYRIQIKATFLILLLDIDGELYYSEIRFKRLMYLFCCELFALLRQSFISLFFLVFLLFSSSFPLPIFSIMLPWLLSIYELNPWTFLWFIFLFCLWIDIPF